MCFPLRHATIGAQPDLRIVAKIHRIAPPSLLRRQKSRRPPMSRHGLIRTRKRSLARKALAITEDPKVSARSAGLRYVTDTSPGMTRKRCGSSFRFYDPDGKQIKAPAELKRIRSLVIPPAWERVWICPRENGHLQATGLDARGRKQYLYHPDWRTVRDEAKYERLISFAKAFAGHSSTGR